MSVTKLTSTQAVPAVTPRKGVVIRYGPKANPRTEYRLRRAEEVKNSPALSEKFPKLKTLRLELEYFDPTGVTRQGGMKYKVTLAHGRSLFCFNCIHGDCIGGDYDLSDQLTDAISRKRKLVEGELRCPGTRHNRNWTPPDRACNSLMRYKLILGF